MRTWIPKRSFSNSKTNELTVDDSIQTTSQRGNDSINALASLPQDEAEHLQQELSRELLSSPIEFDPESLRRRNWVAVPVRDGITDEQAAWIEAAIADIGESKAVCVTTESKTRPEAYEVELSKSGLLKFHYNCLLRPFVLAPQSLTFALLDEADYFYVVAGPEVFVEAAVGRPVAEAAAAFLRYAQKIPESRRTREWLMDIAENYRPTKTLKTTDNTDEADTEGSF